MIREWAREQGLTIGERGIIPREIVDAYKRAHGIGQRIRVYRAPSRRWRVSTGNVVDDVHAPTWREAWDYAVTIAARRAPNHANRSYQSRNSES